MVGKLCEVGKNMNKKGQVIGYSLNKTDIRTPSQGGSMLSGIVKIAAILAIIVGVGYLVLGIGILTILSKYPNLAIIIVGSIFGLMLARWLIRR